MHVVQKDAMQALTTKKVYYKDYTTEAVQPGYVVCYDNDAPETPAANTWGENVLGHQVRKPDAGSVTCVAGIVRSAPSPNQAPDGTNSGMIEIIVPRKGDVFDALTKQNSTQLTTPLAAVSGQWYLADDTKFDDTNLRPSFQTVGIAFETADTSGTAALTKVIGV